MQDLHHRDAIRWAVGSITSRRSATWRLWGDKKGDVYLATRSLGSLLKVSIHRDRRCSVGFTQKFASEAKQRFGKPSRHLERWTLPDLPVAKAIQVVIPDSELASYSANEKEAMAWIPPPGENKVVVFTVFVAEPPTEFVWESPEVSGNLLGVMATKSRFTWVVHHSQVLDEPTLRMINDGKKIATARTPKAQLENVPSEGMRMAMWAGNKSNTDFFIVDIDASKLF